MAITCPVGFDVPRLRELVRETYERVALAPEGDFHFHRGPVYAARMLGYDPDEVAAIPFVSSARFAGVGNPFAAGPIYAGERVLDHACGAGMDLLIAARRVGPRGRAIGVDMTPAMRAAAQRGVDDAGLSERVEIRAGFLEELPLPDASVDVVISNGVVNLSPDKRRVFAEVARVLRPGGRLYLADVVVQRELTLEARSSPDLWAACIAGALPEPELTDLALDVGLTEPDVVERYDCFAGTTAEEKASTDLYVGGVTFVAHKR